MAEPSSSSTSGTPEGFESFVEEHYEGAYRFAYSLSGNQADACDITQQAFYLAQTRGHQLQDLAKRKHWLFTILYREFLRVRRKETAHATTPLEFSEHELPPIHIDHAAGIDGHEVMRLLATLDDIFRMPLALFYLDQLSYKEIAIAVGAPIGTVMSRLARGKQMLRHRLKERDREQAGKVVPLPPVAKGGLDG